MCVIPFQNQQIIQHEYKKSNMWAIKKLYVISMNVEGVCKFWTTGIFVISSNAKQQNFKVQL